MIIAGHLSHTTTGMDPIFYSDITLGTRIIIIIIVSACKW